jgi:hypothetical protein
MGFANEYLARCWKLRRNWPTKSAKVGDWYLSGDPLELKLVGKAEVGRVDFANGEIAFVPDADDLLELLDNQLRAFGFDPADKTMTIRYDPEGQWQLILEYGDRETHVGKQDSFHSLLLYLIAGMAQEAAHGT